MYWKENRYYKAEPLSNASTDKYELPESGNLANIILRFHGANASAIHASNKARIVDHLTKIEITDGGTKTMMSLSGQELKAVHWYDNHEILPESAILYGNQTQRTALCIPFGRFYKDREYMLDMAAWDSVYLEITNDLTTTQFADLACQVDVQLVTAEDMGGAAPKYIKNYEWRSGKPKANTQYVYHELPTLDTIRRVMVQTDPDLNTNGSAVSDPISDSFNMEFTFLQDKETVWDHRPKDIVNANALAYGRVMTAGRYFQSASQRFDLAMAYVRTTPSGTCGSTASTTATAEMVTEESNDRFSKLKNVSAGATAPEFAEILAIGEGYYHTMVLFDARNEPESEYLNPAKDGGGKGPVRINWYGHTDDHTLRTCLSVPIDQGAT